MCRTFRWRSKLWCAPVNRGRAPGVDHRLGRVFVLRADLIDPDMRAAADLHRPHCARGATRKPLRSTRSHRRARSTPMPSVQAKRPCPARERPAALPRAASSSSSTASADLRQDGKEYVTILGPGQSTPAPWINVIANPTFGFQTATEGSGYTWSANSRENQLTPWSNDPVSDPPGRGVLFARRQRRAMSGVRPRLRSATPRRPMSPVMAGATAGSSTPRTASPPICFSIVPIEGSIKISRLTIDEHVERDPSSQRDRLCRVGARRIEIGHARALSRPRSMRTTGAMFARNPWNVGVSVRASLSPTCAARQTRLDRRSPRVHRPQRHAGNPAALAAASPLSNTRRRGAGPLRGDARQARAGAGARRRSRVLARRGRDSRTTRAPLIPRYRAADLDAS